MDTELRINRDPEMHVIRHDLYLDHLRLPVRRHRADDGLQPDVHAIDQHSPPILRAPDDVIVEEYTTLR